jgi:flagellar motor switch protein FliM
MSDAAAPESPVAEKTAEAIQPCDFRGASLLSHRLMRKLRGHEEQFLDAMSTRVALFLRAEFPLRLLSIQIVSYQKLTAAWGTACHLTLFKTEPLRGVSLLQIPVPLALAIVDRLLGGPGQAGEATRELSEIEKALIEQIVQVILEEWCNNWAALKPLKPTLLGCESSGQFLQTSPPETNMLLLSIEARTGDCTGEIQLVFPYAAMEPLLRQLCPETETVTDSPAPAVALPLRWNRALDDVCLPVTAEWEGLEISAGELLHLKAGDVLQLNPKLPQQVCVRLGELSRFNGRLGSADGHWAVELTHVIKP